VLVFYSTLMLSSMNLYVSVTFFASNNHFIFMLNEPFLFNGLWYSMFYVGLFFCCQCFDSSMSFYTSVDIYVSMSLFVSMVLQW